MNSFDSFLTGVGNIGSGAWLEGVTAAAGRFSCGWARVMVAWLGGLMVGGSTRHGSRPKAGVGDVHAGAPADDLDPLISR